MTTSSAEAQREQWRDEGRDEGQAVEELAAPLHHLPPMEFAFAYGSGVFTQPRMHSAEAANEVPMVDYILGVSAPADWHSQNLEQNPGHYASWLARFGGKARLTRGNVQVSGVAENVGVGVHFNAFVPWRDKTIKYGVVSVDNVSQDVLTWQRLYISGRLQKPVRFLVDRMRAEELNRANLHAALAAALLLLPPEFSEEDLYATICGLSYTGDVRMLFAEDKHKVRKIVRGSASKFQELYRGAIHGYRASGILHPPPSFAPDLQSRLVQDGSPSATCSLLSSLPACALRRLAHQTGTHYHWSSAENMAIAQAVVQSREGHAKMVARAVSSIVRASSFRQMVSGFLAAGGVNAVQYVARKVSKAWRSRQ